MRIWLGLSVLALACNTSSPREPSTEAKSSGSVSAAPAPEQGAQRFGSAIQGSSRQSLAEVLGTPDGFQGKTVLVEGHVRRACSRKGCWMEIAESADPKAPGCRVTFKDYGFFVPTDSAGSKARVEGTVQVTTVAARKVEHLEEEGASFGNKQPDGSAREVQLVATGVELRRL